MRRARTLQRYDAAENVYYTKYKSICAKRSVLTIRTHAGKFISVEIYRADSLRHCSLFFVNVMITLDRNVR